MNKNTLYFLGFLLILIFVFFYYFFIFNSKTVKLSDSKILYNENLVNAYFAGGCFWCMEGIFESQDGVKEAISGYIGGDSETGNYRDVSSGITKHREAVKVVYDPSLISFDTLINLYWRQIDPIDAEGQFADRGFQYTTAIYYSNDKEKNIAEENKKLLQNSGKFDKQIATKIIEFTEFYKAEEEHQDYYKKSEFRYKMYKKGSGREGYIKDTWENEDKDDLKSRLTPIQYKVTQENGTEKPYDNEYWDNKEDGIYVDIIDGTPLYSSLDKYESNTGWPSFTKPIEEGVVIEKEDNTLFSKRTEIRGTKSDSHLGHVFPDGPSDKGGLRYCMNSAALMFVPISDLEEKGYGEYLKLFN